MTDALAIQLILSVTSLLTSAVTATALVITSRKTRTEIREAKRQTIDILTHSRQPAAGRQDVSISSRA